MIMRGLWILWCLLVVSGTQGEAAMTTYVDYSRLAIHDTFNGSYLQKNNYRGINLDFSDFPGVVNNLLLLDLIPFINHQTP
jgi:hypothetical protein